MIDSHCHLNFPEFDSGREELLKTCFKCGISSIVIPAVEPAAFSGLRVLCKQQGSKEIATLRYSAGLHPWWVKPYLERNSLDLLKQLLSAELGQSNCIALGETGLHLTSLINKNENSEVKTTELAHYDQQVECLKVHLALSEAFSKPIILHSVKAHSELIKYIKAYKSSRGVVHAFTGSYEQAKAFWDQGFYLGVGGAITYERAKRTREAIKRMPLEALVLETDAPDMPLYGHQGQRNSPVHIVKIADELAALKNESVNVVKQKTIENTQILFDM